MSYDIKHKSSLLKASDCPFEIKFYFIYLSYLNKSK